MYGGGKDCTLIFSRNRFRKSDTVPTPRCPMGYDGPAAPEPAVPAQRPLWVPEFTDPAEAERFIRQFRAEQPGGGDPDQRVREVLDEIDRTGTYEQTAEEVAFGAKVAWRNSARCIGRLYWRSLLVRDLRHLGSADDIADESFEHLRLATNGGRVRPMISIFAPDRPGRPAAGSSTSNWCATPATRTRTAAGRATRPAANWPRERRTWAGSRVTGGSTCCRC